MVHSSNKADYSAQFSAEYTGMIRSYMTNAQVIEKDRLIDRSISLPRALNRRRVNQYLLIPSRAKIANFYHFLSIGIAAD